MIFSSVFLKKFLSFKKKRRDFSKKQKKALKKYFDSDWYATQVPYIKKNYSNLFDNYINFGRFNGIQPNAYFDPQWYLKKNQDVLSAGIDPFLHYCEDGAAERRTPGPLFDPEAYLDAYPDVREAGQEPLHHFLNHGQAEHRHAYSVLLPHHATRNLASSDRIESEERNKHIRVAVALHIFYADMSEEICRYLNNISGHFALFVTVPDAGIAKKFTSVVKKYGLDCDLKVVIGQNRGRNFGPFLVEFRRELLTYDVMLHIHSKKSLRTGNEQTGWKDHLFKSLLANRGYTSFIINRLGDQNNRKFGVALPSTFADFGHWAHDWLGCAHMIPSMLEKLGIDHVPSRGMQDFSVGSMFWARTQALRPLLEYPWAYTDFEEEPAGHDGTVPHVIERGLGTFVESQSFYPMELDYDCGLYRDGWTEKNLHKYEDYIPAMRYAIDHFDTISFDFYDTVFCRKATTPDDIHLYIGHVLRCRFGKYSENEFYHYRKAAEARARQKLTKGDVDIYDIYDHFADVCDWPVNVVTTALDLELQIEERVLMPRDGIVELLQRAKDRSRRVILVSDTYMPLEFFEKVLKKWNMYGYFSELYISSHREARKDQGQIWDIVLQDQQEGNTLFHTGDNFESDVHLPIVRSINALHVIAAPLLAELRGYPMPLNWKKRRITWQEGLLLGVPVARFGRSLSLENRQFRPIHMGNFEDIGCNILGPVFFSFMTWMINHPTFKGITKIAFLAREGYFLHKYYVAMRKALGGDASHLPPAVYLEISRNVSLSALQGINYDDGLILGSQASEMTIADLLKNRIGFELDRPEEFLNTVVSLPRDRAYVAYCLDKIRHDIVLDGAGKLSRMTQYLRQEGLLHQEGLAIVDIGYSGTIQKAFQKIINRGVSGYYMSTTPEVADVNKTAGGEAFGCFNNENSDPQCAVKAMSVLLEGFMTAPHGQVVDYNCSNSDNFYKINPIYKEKRMAQDNFHYFDMIYDGIENYFKEMISIYGPEITKASYPLKEAQAALLAVKMNEIIFSANFWNKIYLEDDFCGNGEIPILEHYQKYLGIASY
ncbi:rhamnan synthesis F family protein [Komagataeibacter sp. FXV3]|uniref:rhamnan synthesis F family protein n=1 Tax=Komagataeibacter sp. FXV3 TaxID=2608998 RepID=UPI00187B9BC1|nr:rhamnan synthesis F family protein [Komagataeibacter sp. FXV3]MBE7731373.1 hypothetical protein [Komagataeibacter sp. FXV3]